jgi:hypothetical protein
MFDKKKLNFWRLAIIFIGFTSITLMSLWLSPQGKLATMMNESMANMASMHLKNATIYDLVGSSDGDSSTVDAGTVLQSQSNDSSQHHDGYSSGIKTLSVITTIIIFTFIPLIIFGTIILAIVWIK